VSVLNPIPHTCMVASVFYIQMEVLILFSTVLPDVLLAIIKLECLFHSSFFVFIHCILCIFWGYFSGYCESVVMCFGSDLLAFR
jgi:hypothetical protein